MPDISRKGMTAAAFPGVFGEPPRRPCPPNTAAVRKNTPSPLKGEEGGKIKHIHIFPALEKGRDHGQENPRSHYRIGSLT